MQTPEAAQGVQLPAGAASAHPPTVHAHAAAARAAAATAHAHAAAGKGGAHMSTTP